MSAARIQDILRNDARLGRLAKQAEKLAAVEKALRRELPEALAQVVSVCNLRDGHLIIAAHDGPAAAKLRQLVQTLADRLRTQVPEITAIQVKVQASSPFNPLQRKHISLGESAGEALLQFASELPASDLKRAVQRLGRRAQPSSKD
ncbi:MAG TPA: DciA family protein [Burkholderiales bacterium]|nr:DciA family protein [Burkholderiales bacterium]